MNSFKKAWLPLSVLPIIIGNATYAYIIFNGHHNNPIFIGMMFISILLFGLYCFWVYDKVKADDGDDKTN